MIPVRYLVNLKIRRLEILMERARLTRKIEALDAELEAIEKGIDENSRPVRRLVTV